MELELRTWVIHVDVRCAIDLPFVEKKGESYLPSTFVGRLKVNKSVVGRYIMKDHQILTKDRPQRQQTKTAILSLMRAL